MKLKELKSKTEQLTCLYDDLLEWGVYGIQSHMSKGIQLQTGERLLFDLAKKNNLELVKSKRDSEEFPVEISVPELKMFAVCTEEMYAWLMEESGDDTDA